MKQDERLPFDHALRTARRRAFPPGQFVGQESFMGAAEILSLARRAGVGPGTSVLDLCCGAGGPGRLITDELGCRYLGVDASSSAVGLARARAEELPCRFEVAEVPPLPTGPFDVVLLLETMLAFQGKEALLRAVSDALAPGGRFAFTVEEGSPLSAAEQDSMPDAETVWPIPLGDLIPLLSRAGLGVRRVRACTRSHRLVAQALVRTMLAERSAITAALGVEAFDDLVAAHRLWCDWMGSGRIRKLAIVAEKTEKAAGQSERDGRRIRSGW